MDKSIHVDNVKSHKEQILIKWWFTCFELIMKVPNIILIIFLQNMEGIIILSLKYDIFVKNINFRKNGSTGDLAEQGGGGSS